MTDDKMFRFDRFKPDGPVDVYQGRSRVGAIHHPEQGAGAMLTLLVPMRISHVIKLGVEARAWKPVPFHVSWYHKPYMSAFELRWPWWFSGERGLDKIVVAAIRAGSFDDAMEAVFAAYDQRPELIGWRFVDQMEPDYNPFTDRFPRAKWMNW